MSKSTWNKGRRRRRRWLREFEAVAVRALPVGGALGEEPGVVGQRPGVGGAGGGEAGVGWARKGKAVVAVEELGACSVVVKSKKRYTKEESRKLIPGFWDDADEGAAPGAPPAALPADARSAALHRYHEYDRTIGVIMQQNTKKQTFVLQCPVVHISSQPTPEEIERFLRDKNDIALRNCPFSIPVTINGEQKHVPVTPQKPDNVEDFTYHIIVITRYSDFTQVWVLVENHSGYIRGFKVVYLYEIPAKKEWMLLGTAEMPTRFRPFARVKYSLDYDKVQQVRMDNGVFSDLFALYVSIGLNPNQNPTAEGIILNMTGFVCLGESPRFLVAKYFFMEGVTRSRENPLWLPAGYPILLRNWSILSKLVFRQYVALLELRLLEEEGLSTPDATEAMTNLKVRWEKYQKIHENVITFFPQQTGVPLKETKIRLELLCGGQLQLLRHSKRACGRILLRLLSYEGHWASDIQSAFEAGRL